MNNLNDPNKLNPIKEGKERKIKEWNENPEVKKNGIEAIDTTKYRKISKSELSLINILAIFGTISILIIAGSIAYSVYQDGSLVPKLVSEQRCEAQTVNVDKGICPQCPDCNCPIIEIPQCPENKIELYCGNETK